MTGTMTAPPESANGRPPRRSLNDAIGRLDEMIDGLSTAIPETIRDTLKESIADAIALGVKAAVVEVLSNRALLEALHGPRRMTLRQMLAAAVTRTRAKVARWVKRAVTSVLGTPQRLRERTRQVWAVRRPVIIALTIGAVVGFAAAWTPSWVAGTLLGIGTAGLSLVVQAGLWARRAVSRLALV